MGSRISLNAFERILPQGSYCFGIYIQGSHVEKHSHGIKIPSFLQSPEPPVDLEASKQNLIPYLKEARLTPCRFQAPEQGEPTTLYKAAISTTKKHGRTWVSRLSTRNFERHKVVNAARGKISILRSGHQDLKLASSQLCTGETHLILSCDPLRID